MLRLTPTVQTTTKQTSYTHKVESVPLSDGIFAYRLTVETETTYPGSRKKPKPSQQVFEGLATKQGLDTVLKEGCPCPPKVPEGYTAIALSHEAMDCLAKDRHDYEIPLGTVTPFTATQNGQSLTPCLYDFAGVFLHDMKGVPYSVGIEADYIDYPRFENQEWDLMGVVTTLMDHSDVTLLPDGGQRRQRHQVPESDQAHGDDGRAPGSGAQTCVYGVEAAR